MRISTTCWYGKCQSRVHKSRQNRRDCNSGWCWIISNLGKRHYSFVWRAANRTLLNYREGQLNHQVSWGTSKCKIWHQHSMFTFTKNVYIAAEFDSWRRVKSTTSCFKFRRRSEAQWSRRRAEKWPHFVAADNSRQRLSTEKHECGLVWSSEQHCVLLFHRVTYRTARYRVHGYSSWMEHARSSFRKGDMCNFVIFVWNTLELSNIAKEGRRQLSPTRKHLRVPIVVGLITITVSSQFGLVSDIATARHARLFCFRTISTDPTVGYCSHTLLGSENLHKSCDRRFGTWGYWYLFA